MPTNPVEPRYPTAYSIHSASLKLQLERELRNARGNIRSDAAEARRGLAQRRVAEVGMIQQVEVLGAEAQRGLVVKNEVTRQACVPIHIPRAYERILFYV